MRHPPSTCYFPLPQSHSADILNIFRSELILDILHFADIKNIAPFDNGRQFFPVTLVDIYFPSSDELSSLSLGRNGTLLVQINMRSPDYVPKSET